MGCCTTGIHLIAWLFFSLLADLTGLHLLILFFLAGLRLLVFHLQEFCNEEPFVIYLLKISLKCILALILLTLQRKCLEKSAAEWLGVKYVW